MTKERPVKVGDLYWYSSVIVEFHYVYKITPRYTHYVDFEFWTDDPKHITVKQKHYIDENFDSTITVGLRKLVKKSRLIKTIFKIGA
jgi:hypothetical protein